jgi:hypothetical protein
MHLLDDPARVAENDHLRSSHIRELVHRTVPGAAPCGRANIPRVIVQFWHDPNNIPSDVGECLETWGPLIGQGFKRVLFDDNEARRLIDRQLGSQYLTAFDLCHHPAMRCDYFRLCYMLRFGGFYVDADEVYQGGDCHSLFRDNKLKIQPLCYDTVTGTMVTTHAFVTKRAHSPHWIFYVNNNPIIAPASHPIIRFALARATGILLSRVAELPDIQSTTGPGNLTASLVRHSIAAELAGKARDFVLLPNWEATSISRWPLSYRHDERNWRLWRSSDRSL